MDNHDTPQSERLEAALQHILMDKKIVKRLRYSTALSKLGIPLTEKQVTLIVDDIMPYLDKQGAMVEITDTELWAFQKRLSAAAWESGDLEENFKLLKAVREQTK